MTKQEFEKLMKAKEKQRLQSRGTAPAPNNFRCELYARQHNVSLHTLAHRYSVSDDQMVKMLRAANTPEKQQRFITAVDNVVKERAAAWQRVKGKK